MHPNTVPLLRFVRDERWPFHPHLETMPGEGGRLLSSTTPAYSTRQKTLEDLRSGRHMPDSDEAADTIEAQDTLFTLLAAAPAMLRALELVRDVVDVHGNAEERKALRDAIVAAGGEA